MHHLVRSLAPLRRGLIIFAAFAAAACSSPVLPDDSGLALDRFNPANPGPDFVRATPAEQDALLQEFWTALTTPPCWDATRTEPIGQVSQYQFFGQNEYRFVGSIDIFFGAVFVHDIGRYRGRVTGIVETWTTEIEAMVLVDRSTLGHVSPNPAHTALTVVRYDASDGPCI